MKRMVYQSTRQKLGSEAIITIVSSRGDRMVDGLIDELWAVVSEFEKRFSRFRPDSELSMINSQSGRVVQVSHPMLELLTEAMQLYHETNGVFNPAVLPALEYAGYDRSFELLKDDDIADRKLPANFVFKYEEMVLEGDQVLLPKGMRIDMGGIGKGYLLDKLATRIAQDETDFWVSLGGDGVFSGVDEHRMQWQVGIQDPNQLDSDIGSYSIPSEGRWSMATSGVTKRRGVRDGQSWHHIIDPVTGKPAESDLLAVTIVGPNSVRADVFAKCCVVLGSEKGMQFLAKYPEYDAYVVRLIGDEQPKLEVLQLIESKK